MKTMTAEFVVQGRFTRFPGKEAIINRLLNGEHPELKIGRDDDGRVILINPETNEASGCIAPNPSYENNYDLLEAFIDTNTPMDVVATEACGKDHHYRIQVTVTVED